MFYILFVSLFVQNYFNILYIHYYLDKTKATSPGTEEGSSPRGTFGALDVWRKYRVDLNKVNEWTANLRMVRITL